MSSKGRLPGVKTEVTWICSYKHIFNSKNYFVQNDCSSLPRCCYINSSSILFFLFLHDHRSCLSYGIVRYRLRNFSILLACILPTQIYKNVISTSSKIILWRIEVRLSKIVISLITKLLLQAAVANCLHA